MNETISMHTNTQTSGPMTRLARRTVTRATAWMIATACALFVSAPTAHAQTSAPAEKEAPTKVAPFMQVVDDAQSVTMQMAVRTLVPADGIGPTITMVAAIHIGDQSFYNTLQQLLDTKDLVLFEGVRPTGAGYIEHEKDMNEAERAAFTERRMRFLGSAVVTYKDSHENYPDMLGALSDGLDARLGGVVAGVGTDAWGNDLRYVRNLETGTFELRSVGPDGATGDEDASADDITVDASSDGVNVMELDTEGIQAILAESLGLVFQLDAMDESKPNWRNSDLSIDQVMQRLDEAGVDGFELIDSLQGNTLGTKIAGFLLKIIGKSKTMRETAKLAMVEVLGSAEDLLNSMPGEMGLLMGVILEQRNDVLLADIASVIENEPEVRELGVIYGAGHLRDVQTKLEDEFGYVHTSDEWVPAMRVDLKALGMSQRQAKSIRSMLKRQIASQMKAMERMERRR